MRWTALGFLLTVLLGGCGSTAPMPPVEPLPPWLVGTWTQTSNSGALTGMETRRTYRFWPDGRYEYWHQLCQAGGTCDGPYETGVVAVSGSRMTLTPQTASAEGLRGYEFAVLRDPVVGDVQLQFALPTGVDVFYYSP